MKTLAIIGAGDLGMQIANYAISDQHYPQVVFFDDFTEEKQINGFQILGKTADIIEQYDLNTFDELIIGIGYKHLEIRKALFDVFLDKVPFGKIVHSTCWVDPSAKVKAGCVLYPGCIVDTNSIIDYNTILNLNCTIAHDTQVGKHCFLSPRVALAGFINIGDQCKLGINSTVIDNILITANTQLGAGTVVINNLSEPGLYVGNPQRFIRKQ